MNNPDHVSLIWRPRKDEKESVSQVWTLVLRMSRHEDAIAQIIKNMQDMGIGAEKNVKN